MKFLADARPNVTRSGQTCGQNHPLKVSPECQAAEHAYRARAHPSLHNHRNHPRYVHTCTQVGRTTYRHANSDETLERDLADLLAFTFDGVIGLSGEIFIFEGHERLAMLQLAVSRPSSRGRIDHPTSIIPAAEMIHPRGEHFVLVAQTVFMDRDYPRVVLDMFGQPWLSLVTREADGGAALKRLLNQECSWLGLPGMEALGQRHLALRALPQELEERMTQALLGNAGSRVVLDGNGWMVGATGLWVWSCAKFYQLKDTFVSEAPFFPSFSQWSKFEC